jgi:DNA-binding GntR family transcriptional regulator
VPAGEGVRIPFTLHQSLLAGLTGDSRETVNRALSRLVADGVVARDPAGVLTVLRPEALRRALG